jgi:hypothetical protein
MKLKTPELEIPPADPFNNDLLGRKDSAVALTELICSTNEPLVLSINASWGEGKTTFLKMWRQMLHNKEVKTLYFNAWENDFSDDAFVSLIGELELGIEELSLTSSDESKEQLLKAKKFAASIIKRGIPTAVKLVTAGLVNLDEFSEKALAEYGEKLAEDEVKRYENSKKSVAGFKQALSDLATAISDEKNPLPLVILIDELDRCRPIYAVKVLEAVKHFFSVQNVVFVLALDRKQLGHSICSMYGAGMDVSGYLRRFIDIDYNLPYPKKGAFCKAQFLRFGLVDLLKKRTTRESQYELENLDNTFSELFEVLGCSLREQERSFALLSMAIRTTPANYPIHPILLGALIILKIKNHELYKDFVQGKAIYSDVLNFIGNTSAGKAFLNDHHGSVLEAYLACSATRRHEASDILQKYQTAVINSTDELEKARAQKIVSIVNKLISDDRYGMLGHLVGKIDLVSNFREYA